MKIKIEINEQDVKRLIAEYIEERTGNPVEEKDVVIYTKSKQNYRSEWEPASFKVEYVCRA